MVIRTDTCESIDLDVQVQETWAAVRRFFAHPSPFTPLPFHSPMVSPLSFFQLHHHCKTKTI